jgi:hypothetical protein
MIKIGDKSYEVDSVVEAYVNTLKQQLQDTKQKLATAKEDAIKELRAEQEKKELVELAKANNIQIGDESKVSIDYLKGIKEALKFADADFKPVEQEKNLNFDSLVIDY